MNLGLLYFNARGVRRDVVRASGLLRTAYEKGMVAGRRARRPRRAAPARAPGRHTEGQGPDDGLAAFRGYAIAEWLYADVGATATAAIARARTATLARSLPPEAVAAAWAEVQMRKKAIAAPRRRGVAERLGGFWPSFFARWTERT